MFGNSSQFPSWLLVSLGFFVAVAYIPGWTGAAIPTTYMFLMIVLPFFLLKSIDLTKSHLYGTLFILYACFSLLWTLNFNIGLFVFCQYILLGMIFCLGSMLDDLKPVVKGLAIGLGVSAILCVQQYVFYKFGMNVQLVFANFTVFSGLFVNANVLCEVSVLMLVVLIVYKMWWWIPVTLPGLFIIHSRAALIGLFCCGCIYLYYNRPNYLYFVCPLALLLIGYLFWFGNLSSVYERFALWKDTVRGFSVFGSGVGSYELRFPLHAADIDTSAARPRYAHNDYLHLIYEFGIGALLLVPILFNALKVDRNEKYILICFLVIALFAFPLFSPMSAFIGCLVTGYLVSFYYPGWIGRSYRGLALSTRN